MGLMNATHCSAIAQRILCDNGDNFLPYHIELKQKLQCNNTSPIPPSTLQHPQRPAFHVRNEKFACNARAVKQRQYSANHV